MGSDQYTYEQLEALTARLQREVSRHIKVEQDLISTREALDREIARLRVLQAFNGRALNARDQEELVRVCLETVIDAFEFECSAMFRWDAQLEELRTLGAFGLDSVPDRLSFDPSVLEGERSLVFAADHPVLASWPDMGLVQVIACPLCDESGGLAGLVVGGRTRAKSAYYPPIRAELCSPFAVLVQQISAVWINYRLNVIVRDRKYKVLFHRSNDGILLVSVEGDIVDTNARALEMFGYTHAEMTRMTVFDLTESDPAGRAQQLFSRIVDTGSLRFERQCLTKTGEVFPAEVSASLFELDGQPMVHGLIRDISDLKRSQRQLVLSERMAALGQLIAGVAHEINTPVGVIRASIGNIEASLGETLSRLPLLLRSMDPKSFALFLLLIERAGAASASLSSREERQARRKIAAELAAEGLSCAEVAAELLVATGITSGAGEYLPLLAGDSAEILEAAFNLASLQRNADNIRAAIEGATKVVFALKKFAHSDPEGKMSLVDLVDGIETILTLYHNKLKQGVEVVRSFEELPQVRCHADELNQVWTNLIHNAIQAMGGKGRLEVCAERRGDAVHVAVIDDGPGIPAGIRERIFEPFFTTKAAGEGSGLGLDICRKIVERHHGTIEANSRPGRTEMRVVLPLGGGAE
jgi:PAS domain S-box-containing protein